MSEFNIISKIKKTFPISDKSIKKGIGDDCAIIDRKNFYEIITTDMYIEEDHFSLKWSSPKQIGIKAFEATISDIAAMGGLPKYLLVSLCISKKVDENKFINEFYNGFKERINHWDKFFKKHSKLHSIPSLIGGDITHGDLICINVTVIGEVKKNQCISRCGAKVGDLICVTGNLGGSWAGLEYLRKFNKLSAKSYQLKAIKKNLEPHCRLDASIILKDYANSMIDISDGLASEVSHICKESNLGAIVYKDKIPLSKTTIQIAKFLNKDPYKWALSGGEDFELCFTVSTQNYKQLTVNHKQLTIFCVGEILPKSKGIHLIENTKKLKMPKGYEHF